MTDDLYRERAYLIAHLAAIYDDSVIVVGGDPAEPGWPVIYIETETGQWSWHLSPDDVALFPHVPREEPGEVIWDGHTTEEKLDRIRALTVRHVCEKEAAQAEWESSGEAPHCSMVEVDGEQIRANARLNTDADHAAFREMVTAARRKFVAERAAERAEIEREVRAQVAAEFRQEADRYEAAIKVPDLTMGQIWDGTTQSMALRGYADWIEENGARGGVR